MRVCVTVTTSTSGDPKSFVHGHERDKADHDRDAEEHIPVVVDENEAHAVVDCLAEKDLGEEVEERVTEQTADGERDHDGERGRVDVGRT